MKRKTIKRMLGRTISMSLVSSMLATTAVSVSAETEAYEYKTGITLTLGGRQGSTEDWGETDLIAKMEEKFGVTINCEPYSDDAWSSKFAIDLAEDDLADFYTVAQMSLTDIGVYGSDGYLLPLNEYMEHMPNLAAFLEAHPDYEAACTSADGNIYTLVQYSEVIQDLLPRNYIRNDWVANVGMEMPTSVDELYDVLVAFRDQDANGNGDPNDEIPFIFSSAYSRQPQTSILAAYDLYVQSASSRPYFILQVDDNGTVFLGDVTENYKDYLKYMNKLWEEGLIYNESYTITIAEVREMCADNIVGVEPSTINFGEADNYSWLAGLTSEYNDTPKIQVGNQVGSMGKLMISADTEYPEEICRIIDWFFTEEGANWAQNGDIDMYDPEYTTYDLEGYEDFEITEVVSDPPEGYADWGTHRYQKRTINESFNFWRLIDTSYLEAMTYGSQEDEHLREFRAIPHADSLAIMQMGLDEIELVKSYPVMVCDGSVAEERATLVTDLTLYCEAATAQFITGEVDVDEGWDNYVATLENMGLSRLLEIEQETYDRMYK